MILIILLKHRKNRHRKFKILVFINLKMIKYMEQEIMYIQFMILLLSL